MKDFNDALNAWKTRRKEKADYNKQHPDTLIEEDSDEKGKYEQLKTEATKIFNDKPKYDALPETDKLKVELLAKRKIFHDLCFEADAIWAKIRAGTETLEDRRRLDVLKVESFRASKDCEAPFNNLKLKGIDINEVD